MQSTLFQCLCGVQDQFSDSTPLLKIFCFLTHSNNFGVGKFVFKTRRLSFLYHQVSSPSAGYLVRCSDGKKRKFIVLPVTKNNTFSKVIFAVHIDLKLDYAFSFVSMFTRVQDQIPDSTSLFKAFCSLTHSFNFAGRPVCF